MLSQFDFPSLIYERSEKTVIDDPDSNGTVTDHATVSREAAPHPWTIASAATHGMEFMDVRSP